MSEFFGRLEAELREAALRPPRRLPDVRPLVAAAAALALAAVPVLLVLGGGGDDPPASPPASRAVDPLLPNLVNPRIVAEGEAPVAGRWRMVSYASERLESPESGEMLQPAGLRCLGIQLVDGTEVTRGLFGGQCGEWAQTPGFGRVQHTVHDAQNRPRETLLYGRTPETTEAIQITGVPDATNIRLYEGPPGERGDFYLAVLPPDAEGRVNWLNARGEEGSRGLALVPPP
jgi:hypothetical protein